MPHALPGGFGSGPDSGDGLGGAQGARSSQRAPTELPGRIAALEEVQRQPQALVARPARPGVAVAADGDGAAGRGAAGDLAGRGAAEASVEGRGPLSEVVGWRCLPPGSRSVGAASRRLAFGGTGRAQAGPAGAPSTPADVLSTLMLPTGPLAASARSPAPAVTATGGVRGAVWSDRRDSGPNPGRLPLNVSPATKSQVNVTGV